MTDGMYDLGTVTTLSGSLSNIVVEGLDGIGYELQHNGNKLQLRVGSGVAVDCAEPTIDIAMVGQQPVATIKPVAFDYNGTTVTPTLSAKFNGEDVDLVTMTLYEEDYEQATEIGGWTNSGAPISLANDNGEHGKYFLVDHGNTNTRYAYTRLKNVDVSQCAKYAIEFDLAIKSGNTDPVEFCVMSKGGTNPSNVWDNYAAINGNKNMLFDITAPKVSTTYTVNGSTTTTTLASDTWYHISLEINRTAGIVVWAISNGDNGVFTLPEGTSSEVDGFYLVMGRYYSLLRLDNIRIYQTDSYYYTFNKPGTLEVTASYPGCKPTKKVCTVATIDELATTPPESQDNVSYVMVKRPITANQWNTICLPFSMTSQQVKNSFGDQVQLANFTGYDYQNGNITVNFETVDHMEANHPYIIKLPTAISSFNVSGNMSIAPSSTPMTSGTSGKMVGTYVANTTIAKNLLFLSDNMFWYSVGKTKMKALRAWFDFDDVLPSVDGAATRIVLSVDGETIGVGRVIDIAGNGEVYDLQGRKVKRPARQGIYISGGRKIIR
jgi:hypothetical protein